MATVTQSHKALRLYGISAWLPLVAMPAAVALLGGQWPGWVLMWTLSISIYAGFKWLTFADCAAANRAAAWRRLGYLWLWPGMDAGAFFSVQRTVARPSLGEWTWAVAKTLIGVAIVYSLARAAAVGQNELLAGWVGM